MRISIPVMILSAAAVLAHQQQPFDEAPSSSPHPHPLLRRPPPSDDRDRKGSLVSEGTYRRLEHFAKYACAAYLHLCPFPLGNTLVQSVRLLCLPPLPLARVDLFF
jgi:hypothetical protein